jgi:hypothetical protein
MNDLLRDPVWQFVGAVLTVLTIVVAVIIYFLQKGKKSLSYDVVTNVPLFSANEEIKNDLQIHYKGFQVKNLHLFVFKIINDGNQPIPQSDYEKPLNIVLYGDVQILSVEIVSQNPSNLGAEVTAETDRIQIKPVLMNSKDYFKVKAVINAESFSFKPDARIIGVKSVKEYKQNLSYFYYWYLIWTAISGVFLLNLSISNTIGIVTFILLAIVGFIYIRQEVKSFMNALKQFD